MAGLAYAMRTLPIGTAYAVWTGIGAAGTFLVGILFFGVLFTQWVRSSMQEARREDRRLDREERRTPTPGG